MNKMLNDGCSDCIIDLDWKCKGFPSLCEPNAVVNQGFNVI